MTVWCTPQAAADAQVGAELVLAVDASDSIEDWEWRLELSGIAAAFRDPDVQQDIAALPGRRIAVALLVWAGADAPHPSTGWQLVGTPNEAEAFASLVETYPRSTGGGTAMGEGVAASLRLLVTSPYASARRIIDVSGDGVEPVPFLTERFVMMGEARAMVRSAGVTMNGLAIVKDQSGLIDWYADNVPVGRGAFVMQVHSMRDFAPAFKEKLLRELQPDLSLREGTEPVAVALVRVAKSGPGDASTNAGGVKFGH